MKQNITSKIITQSDFETKWFAEWCKVIQTPVRYHRKLGEFVLILDALEKAGMLSGLVPRKGIGFGVGQEPIPSILSTFGCNVLGTDLDISDPNAQQWDNGQLAKGKESLYKPNIVDENTFNNFVDYRTMDMNSLPDDSMLLNAFDFSWSSCCFEHLGSIEKGLDFIVNQMKYLKKGGVAVHTTEFNVFSDDETLDNDSTVIFRKQDIERLFERLRNQGYKPYAVDYNIGELPMDLHIDLPPYCTDKHLKLRLGEYTSASIILIIEK